MHRARTSTAARQHSTISRQLSQLTVQPIRPRPAPKSSLACLTRRRRRRHLEQLVARRRKGADAMDQQQPDAVPDGMQPLYTVGTITDTTMLGPSGQYVRAKRVPYVLADGTQSYIEVPLADFNRATVQRLLDAAVMTHLDVATIQGAAVPKVY